MIKLQIEDGVVTNCIRVDPDNIPAAFADLVTAPDGVGIGDLYDGTTFTKPQPDTDALAEMIRQQRDLLLAETDWWATSDRTMTQAQIDYRQALRDITDQAGFPTDVTWPTKPE